MQIRIVYASQACSNVTHADIDELVEWSRVYNRDHHVMGVLAFDGFQIVQIIEGDALVVDPLFDRICADTRHEGVVVLMHNIVDHPRFKNWSMVRRPIADVLMLVESIRT